MYYCEHTLFTTTQASIRARYRCPSTRQTEPLYSGSKVGTESLCVRRRQSCLYHTHILVLGPKTPAPASQASFLFVLGLSTAVYSLLSSCFKMASDKAKWSNYIQNHISGTKSVNTKPFCAGIQALIPEYQVWTSP